MREDRREEDELERKLASLRLASPSETYLRKGEILARGAALTGASWPAPLNWALGGFLALSLVLNVLLWVQGRQEITALASQCGIPLETRRDQDRPALVTAPATAGPLRAPAPHPLNC